MHKRKKTNKPKLKSRILVCLWISLALLYIWQLWNSFALYSEGLKDFGQIGDLFSGVFNPLIGLLSAGMIYITLMEQVKANRALTQLQRKAIRAQISQGREIRSIETKNYVLDSVRMLIELIDTASDSIESEDSKTRKRIKYWIDFFQDRSTKMNTAHSPEFNNEIDSLQNSLDQDSSTNLIVSNILLMKSDSTLIRPLLRQVNTHFYRINASVVPLTLVFTDLNIEEFNSMQKCFIKTRLKRLFSYCKEIQEMPRNDEFRDEFMIKYTTKAQSKCIDSFEQISEFYCQLTPGIPSYQF